jgi:hypothetical protein
MSKRKEYRVECFSLFLASFFFVGKFLNFKIVILRSTFEFPKAVLRLVVGKVFFRVENSKGEGEDTKLRPGFVGMKV